MKYLLLIISTFIAYYANAAGKDSTLYYPLPDSVKAISFLADINIQSSHGKKAVAGITANDIKLFFQSGKKGKELVFQFPASANIAATGMDIRQSKGQLKWVYNWKENETYKLLLAAAGDSAGNFVLYSGYAWLPGDNKWKLIGTCRISGRWNTITQPASFFSDSKKNRTNALVSQPWAQRNNGSWKKLDSTIQPAPVINLFSHVDSVARLNTEKKIIGDMILAGNTDVKDNIENVYYRIIKEGTGKQVSIDDTVTVYYKLTILNDTAIIDQAKDKPATFPLKRLIRGWQLGVPLTKTGGKIKLVIPSSLAYSIRTRAPKIPPNSILVFEIEVVDTKPPSL